MLRRSTLVVVVLFLALLGVALYLQRNPLAKSGDSTPTTTPAPNLLNFGTATIVKMKVENKEGKTIELVKGNADTWEITSIGPAESSTVNTAVTQLSAIKILSRLDPAPSMAAMDLETPVEKITLSLDDGRVLTIDVGAQTPTQSGYYVRVDNGEPVVVSRYSISSALDFLENPPLPPTPQPTETLMPLPSAETTAQPIPEASATKAP
jgi:hypothetical protein